MFWLQRYRIWHYITNSIWILPLFGMFAGIKAARLLYAIDQSMSWKLERDLVSVQSMLGTMAASMFTLIVFISSSLLVSIQLASAQLTPRIIGFVFRDRVTKFT